MATGSENDGPVVHCEILLQIKSARQRQNPFAPGTIASVSAFAFAAFGRICKYSRDER